MATVLYEIAFSRAKPAAWPPLHAQRIGESRTLCGISTGDWDFDYLFPLSDHVECKRCLRVLEAEERRVEGSA